MTDERPDLLHPLELILRGKTKILKYNKTEDEKSAVLEIRTATETVDFYVERNGHGQWQGFFHVAPLEGPLQKESTFNS
jgi:hypothetical protein